LIGGGHDVVISDSRTGEDITNLILLQVLLEKDQPKLDLFPSAILHLMIRSNRPMIRTFFERSFGPFLELLSRSQRQFDTYLRQAMSGKIPSPFEWADSIMNVMSPGPMPGEPDPETDEVESPPDTPSHPEPGNDDLRGQVAELNRRVSALTKQLSQRQELRDNGSSGGRTGAARRKGAGN
jgi:polyhydroxyalkanoate synthesis regulator protein